MTVKEGENKAKRQERVIVLNLKNKKYRKIIIFNLIKARKRRSLIHSGVEKHRLKRAELAREQTA